MPDKINDGMTPQARYIKKHIKRVVVQLNRNTDADILEHLTAIGNQQGYIKSLIRADMSRNK